MLSYFDTGKIYEEQVSCRMGKPKLYEVLRWQIEQVHKNIQPDGYLLSHDEIRVAGSDESCRRAAKTPGDLLADNVAKCMKMVRKNPRQNYAWSDMFDPSHNAQKSGRYYLVKGEGPWFNSWKGLDKGVVIVNWNSGVDKRIESLKHFSGLGNHQILAGYYDGPVDSIRGRLRDGEQAQASSERCTRPGRTSTETWRLLQSNCRRNRIKGIKASSG